jgi:hypothetical protein
VTSLTQRGLSWVWISLPKKVDTQACHVAMIQSSSTVESQSFRSFRCLHFFLLTILPGMVTSIPVRSMGFECPEHLIAAAVCCSLEATAAVFGCGAARLWAASVGEELFGHRDMGQMVFLGVVVVWTGI